MTKEIIEEKEKNEIQDPMNDYLLKSFSTYPELCNRKHLTICMCQRPIFERFYKQEYKKLITDVLEKDEKLDGKKLTEGQRANIRLVGRKEALQEAFRLTANFCTDNDIRCPVEKEVILQDLNLFYNKYESIWDDVRVQVVMGSMINFKLSSHRMQKYSNEYGLVQTYNDKDGNTQLKLNVVEVEKRKYDEARIKAISELDKMIEGTKSVSVNLDFKREITEAFKKSSENDKK